MCLITELGVLISLFPRSLQELNIRFEPPGITGIPPQPSDEEEDTDYSHTEDKPPLESVPPTTSGPSPATILPVALDQSAGFDSLKKSTDDLPGLEDIKTPYAPGQMSPSVKLMPPGLFSSPSTASSAASVNPSTYTTPTLPLRSPSDFESIPTITPQQTETNGETGNVSSPTQGNNSSQIVTVPLKRLTSSDDEYNEEMVLNASATTPTGSNGQLGAFPSAHDSNNNIVFKMTPLKEKVKLDKVGEDEGDEWPLLHTSSEEQLQQSHQEMEQEGTDGETVMEKELKQLLMENDYDEAAKTASIVVSMAISAAVDIVEGIKENEEQEQEQEFEKGVRIEKRKQGEEEKEGQEQREEEEEEETEVKMKEFVTGYREEGPDALSTEDSDAILMDIGSSKPDTFHPIRPDDVPVSAAMPDLTGVIVDERFLEPVTELVKQQQLEIHALRFDAQ